MSQAAAQRLAEEFGLTASAFRGDDEVVVNADDWLKVATFARDDEALALNHFIDLTAIDHPAREPRFDVVVIARSHQHGHRVRLRTQVADGQSLASLTSVWVGADWAEREVWDMFGIAFEGHPDLRRILMYEEFEGYPLRKDYPIDRVQPLVPYRTVQGVHKLPPFGIEEGQPFARVNWEARLAGGDRQVSPSIALQQGQRHTLSDSEAAQKLRDKIAAQKSESTDASTQGGD